jgi:hypothetical protein
MKYFGIFLDAANTGYAEVRRVAWVCWVLTPHPLDPSDHSTNSRSDDSESVVPIVSID